MDIREILLIKHSKTITNKVLDIIYGEPNQLETLLTLFYSDENPIIRQRAASVVGHIGVDKPELILPYLDDIVDNFIIKGHHDAIYRNTLRFLQFINIPNHLQGNIVTTCFDLLSTPKTPIAIKAFSMTVLYNISNEEPDLKPELKLTLEDIIPNASKGEVNRAKKIIQLLNKEIH